MTIERKGGHVRTIERAFHTLRVVFGSGLIGAVALGTIGTLLSLSPIFGNVSFHEIGAVIGGGMGLAANAKHII